MPKSVLSRRIDVCKSIANLNKNGSLAWIGLLGKAMELNVTKMFMCCSNDWTPDHITQFENEIKQTLSKKRSLPFSFTVAQEQ